MAKAYSADLRGKVLEFVKQGGGKREAAERFQVARSAVYKWLKRLEEGKDLEYVAKSERSRKLDWEAVVKFTQENPDFYLYEIGEHFGIQASHVHRILRKYGITRKKKSIIR